MSRPRIFLLLLPLIVLIALIALPLNSLSAGQTVEHLKFERIDLDDGLPNSTVNCILQDRRGFMWFATGDGLVRYDGYEMKVYTNALKDENSLSNNYVQSLFEDKDGLLWIGTYGGGLNRFDPVTEKFTRLLHNPVSLTPIRSVSTTSVSSIRTGKASCRIGTYGGGFNRYDPRTGKFTNYHNDPDDPESLSDDNIYNICPDGEGYYWLATDVGLDRFDPRTGRVQDLLPQSRQSRQH